MRIPPAGDGSVLGLDFALMTTPRETSSPWHPTITPAQNAIFPPKRRHYSWIDNRNTKYSHKKIVVWPVQHALPTASYPG